MPKFIATSLIAILLVACGSQPIKPEINHSQLIAALIAHDHVLVEAEKKLLKINRLLI